MTRFHGIVFRELECFWSNLKQFFHNHKTLFDIIFLIIYSLEQVFLFMLLIKYPNGVLTIVGGFIIIFLTTISFEKICMESRYTGLKEKIMDMKVTYNKTDYINKDLTLMIENSNRK